jgi:anti-anti-sigma regulatory factor
MYLLGIDRTKNRVHITLSDRFDALQAKTLSEELTSRLEELERGFCMLCDLTTLEEFDPSAAKHYESMMDLCNKNGVSKIIRIIPNPARNFGLTVMSYFHYDREIPVVTCSKFREVLGHL